jgi:tetratricopeptide (TPR) repeat protein
MEGIAELTDASIQRTAQGSALARTLEAGRRHAETTLRLEQAGEIVLSTIQHDEMNRRARGILPETMAGRFAEVLACPDLQPRRVAGSAERLVAAMDEIECELGSATALAFGLLSASGIHQPEVILSYADKLDSIWNRVVGRAPVLAAMSRLTDACSDEDRFDARFMLLSEARRALWALKPSRVADDFLLTQVIDNYSVRRAGAGNSLGLAAFDSVIVGRLGFKVGYLVRNDVVRLEVDIDGRSVCWDVLEPTTIAVLPAVTDKRLDRRELTALYYGSLGTYCFAQGRWDKAIELYQRSLCLRPDSAGTYTSIGMCYLRKQLPSEAIRVLHRAQSLAPDSAEAHYLEGNAYSMMQHWPKAVGAYRRALELKPDYAEAANNLGLAYASMGSPAKAQAAFEQATNVRPDYYQARFNLGNLLLEQRQYDAAIAAYREVCRLEPGFAPARYNMGRAYYEKHDLDGSISCYRKAVQLNPRHFGAWHNLGIAYRDKGMVEKAVEALERAVTLNPCLMR